MPLTDTAPNNGMQATAYSLRLAVLGSGFPPRLMPGVRLLGMTYMGPEKPTVFQKQVAAALGIDISHDTQEVAAARIHTFVGPAIRSKAAQYMASERQIAFAHSLGLDVTDDSSLVASAKIADELYSRNKASLEKLQLQPGDRVRVRYQFESAGEIREWVQEAVVSSIQPNCRIMFKGGQGSGAWPTQVEKIAE